MSTTEWKTLAEIEDGFGSAVIEILTLLGMLDKEKNATTKAVDEGYSQGGLWKLDKIQAIIAVLEMVDWRRVRSGETWTEKPSSIDTKG